MHKLGFRFIQGFESFLKTTFVDELNPSDWAPWAFWNSIEDNSFTRIIPCARSLKLHFMSFHKHPASVLYWGLPTYRCPSYLHIQRIKFRRDRKYSALHDKPCMTRHLRFQALLVPKSNQLERTQPYTKMITGVLVLRRHPLPCCRVLFSVRMYRSSRIQGELSLDLWRAIRPDRAAGPLEEHEWPISQLTIGWFGVRDVDNPASYFVFLDWVLLCS